MAAWFRKKESEKEIEKKLKAIRHKRPYQIWLESKELIDQHYSNIKDKDLLYEKSISGNDTTKSLELFFLPVMISSIVSLFATFFIQLTDIIPDSNTGSGNISASILFVMLYVSLLIIMVIVCSKAYNWDKWKRKIREYKVEAMKRRLAELEKLDMLEALTDEILLKLEISVIFK
jgi:hypothetical protein